MTISNKRKAKEKTRLVLVDLAHIPRTMSVDEWCEHLKTTGILITKQGKLTKREYEEKRENFK